MRPTSSKKRIAALELISDAVLLTVLVFQGVLIGCLLVYGYIPLPAKWTNQQLEKVASHNLYLQGTSFGVELNGEIKANGVRLFSRQIETPLLEADHAIVRLSLFGQAEGERIAIRDLTVAGGTLFIPGVYSPDGKRTRVVERISFLLRPEVNRITIDRFAAQHEGLKVRGSVEWPVQPRAPTTGKEEDYVGSFYKGVSQALKQQHWLDVFEEPTLALNLKVGDSDTVIIDTSIFATSFEYAQVKGHKVRLDSSCNYDDGQIRSSMPLRLRAESVAIDRYDVFVDELDAELSEDALPGILDGAFAPFAMSAAQVRLNEIEFDTPLLRVDLSEFPIAVISGTTQGLNGAVGVLADFNLAQKSGNVLVGGAVDFLSLLDDAQRSRFPKVEFSGTPYYIIKAIFEEDFRLLSADLSMITQDITVGGIGFDSVVLDAVFSNGMLQVGRFWLERGPYWADFGLQANVRSKEYSVSIKGWAIPYEYNAILPRWWEVIMRDIRLFDDSSGFGDFIIHGNYGRPIADSYFGHAWATHVSYNEIEADEADLIVRAKGLNVELHNLSAKRGDDAWAKGNVQFSSFPDRKPSPVSVRFDFDANLPLDAVGRIFGPDIAQVIGKFTLSQNPYVEIDAVVFNKAYSEFVGKNQIQVIADTRGAGTFEGIPFDDLQFTLYGGAETTYLRNVRLGFADGMGEGELDIQTGNGEDARLRLKMKLEDANRAAAIAALPQIKEFAEPDDGDTDALVDQSRIDLDIHIEGPFGKMPEFFGFGVCAIRDSNLGQIRLLGPLSSFLENTPLGFTSVSLDRLSASFELKDEVLRFDELRMFGPQTVLDAQGVYSLSDNSMDIEVSTRLFGNVGKRDGPVRKITNIITAPVPMLLRVNVTGTLKDQKIRSLYDPRNFLPSLK